MNTDKPWLTEPNHVEFEHAGFPCIIHRNDSGAWCGYVGVPPSHPLHGKSWSDGGYKNENYDVYHSPPTDVLDVHGGITYANACQGPICHKTKPGEPDDVWWFGFDCAHSGDFVPSSDDPESSSNRHMRKLYPDWGPLNPPWPRVYRDQAYVTEETKNLANQLASLQG